MVTESQPDAGDYASIFHEYVVRGAQEALAGVTSNPASLDVAEQEQALHTLTYALDLPEAWPSSRDLMIALAPRLEQAGYREEWIPLLQEGIERCRAAGDNVGEGELLYQLAFLHQLLGRMDDAAEALARSAGCFAAAGEPARQGDALGRRAFVLRIQKHFDQALALADRSLALLPAEDPARWYGVLVRGAVAQDKQEYAQAIKHYEQALAIAEESGNLRRTAWALNNLGPVLRIIGREDDAVSCYLRAIDILRELGDALHEASARMNLGSIYLNNGQHERAYTLYLQTETVFRSAHDPLRMAYVTSNLALVCRKLERLEQSIQYAEASIHFNRQIGDLSGVANALDCLAEAYLDAGRNVEAEAALREALEILESVRGEPGIQWLVDDVTRHLEEAILRQTGG